MSPVSYMAGGSQHYRSRSVLIVYEVNGDVFFIPFFMQLIHHVCFLLLGWQQVCFLLRSDNRKQHGETYCYVGVIMVCATGHVRKLVEHLVDITPLKVLQI